MITPVKQSIKTALLCALLVACAHEQYQAKPIDATQTSLKLQSKSPVSTDFNAYLIKQGYVESALPFTSWGLAELTHSALFYHTKLDVVKAQLAAAKASLASAGVTQSPTINGQLAHSNQKNGDINPWAFGLNVEIPIETTNKRAIKIEEATHSVDIANIDVAETAWQLRSQLATDLCHYHQQLARQQLLGKALKQQDALLSILDKRLQLGMLSSGERNQTKLALQSMRVALSAVEADLSESRTKLAADAGLSTEQFTQVKIRPLKLDAALIEQAEVLEAPNSAKQLQEKALLNRLDIRRALSKYAVAESKIKLEVAKQTPDISLSPGFAFEFGDSIWSLGFSSLLTLLNKHPTQIAEAISLREVEGAQFEDLQANIIAELALANIRYQTAKQQLADAKSLHETQLLLQLSLQKQLNAGLIDRLELTQAGVSLVQSEIEVQNKQFALLKVALEIENLMQYPIFNNLDF